MGRIHPGATLTPHFRDFLPTWLGEQDWYRSTGTPRLAAGRLIAMSEHSVLGTRWIYDGVADPVWTQEFVRLVRTDGQPARSQKSDVGPAEARGRLLTSAELTAGSVTIDLRRVVTEDQCAEPPDAVGLVRGTWHVDGREANGCLAVVSLHGAST